MNKKSILITLALLLVISLMAIGCPATPPTTTPPTTTPPATKPIKIGLLFDYSGMGAADIPFHEPGARLKLDEVGWEVAGRQIELITADNGGDPVKGVEAVQKMVEVDKVDVIIGPVWGHVALAIAPVLADTKTPLVIPSGQIMDVINAGAGNVFLIRGTFSGNAYYSGVYAYEDLGYRTAVVLYDDFATGEAFAKGFIEPFEERGGTIIQTVKPPLGTFDFAPYLSNMEKADVVAMWIQPPELPSFYKQYNEYGLKMPIIYTSDTAQSETWEGVGDYYLGTIAQHEYSALLDNDANKEFMDILKTKESMPYVDFLEAGYTAVAVFLKAVEATNGDTTPDKINEALRKVSVDTPEGKISFTDEGVGIGNELIVKIAKINDSYEKEILKTYEQVVRKAPWE